MSQTWGADIAEPAGTGTKFSDIPGNLNDKFAALRSQFSGTAFPSSPVGGQPCYRTDRLTASGAPKLYVYTAIPALGESGWVEWSVFSDVGDEVVDARGTKPTLDQRLDVAMNEDGTLKASTSLNPSQWQDMTGHTFTYLSTTSFKIDGDQRDIYKQARRLKINLAASIAYSEVVSASWSSGPNETTVQVLDAVLDATLVNVQHSLFLPDWDGKSAVSPRMAGNRKVKTVTNAMSPYTTTLNDETLLADCSAGAVTIIVLDAAVLGAGRRQQFIKIDNTTNAMTVDGSGSQTINGNLTYSTTVPLVGIEVESDGANLKTTDDSSDKLTSSDLVQDFVVSGLLGTLPGATLTMTVPGGIAYVIGRRVVKLSADADLTRAYTASKDTYVDISQVGAITYTEVANGAGAPSVAANSLRLMKVVTNGTQVTAIADLRKLSGAPGALINIQILTTGTLYTPTPGTRSIIVDVIGAGGGGGGAAATSSQASCGAGGGAGSWARKRFTGITGTYNYSLGTGGAGGVGASSGTAGGDTTFTGPGSVQVVGYGGTGGSSIAAGTAPALAYGGAGGAGVNNGDFYSMGASGKIAYLISAALAIAGEGGSNIFGAGGQGSINTNPGGLRGANYGAGGAGTSNVGTQTSKIGGIGGQGVIVIWEFS